MQCRGRILRLLYETDDFPGLIQSRIAEPFHDLEIVLVVQSDDVSFLMERFHETTQIVFKEIIPSEDYDVFIDQIMIEYELYITD